MVDRVGTSSVIILENTEWINKMVKGFFWSELWMLRMCCQTTLLLNAIRKRAASAWRQHRLFTTVLTAFGSSTALWDEWNAVRWVKYPVDKELYHLNLISQKSTMHESPYSLQRDIKPTAYMKPDLEILLILRQSREHCYYFLMI